MDQLDPPPPGARTQPPQPSQPPEPTDARPEQPRPGQPPSGRHRLEQAEAEPEPFVAAGLDLLREAPNAAWSSNAGRLTFGGQRDDPDGFAIYPKPRLLLEDNSRRVDLLETHPRWTDDGWIRGEFWVPRVGPDHHFLTEIGFIQPQGDPQTNGVTVLILFDF